MRVAISGSAGHKAGFSTKSEKGVRKEGEKRGGEKVWREN